MTFKNLSEVWCYYDNKERKQFDAHDICNAISSVQDVSERINCKYELLAFSFVHSRGEHNKWGTFYGYQLTFERDNTGEEVFFPNITDITPEIIEYWEMRVDVVINPLLRMRYTGLVWDFKRRITGSEPDYERIKLANIKAIIDVVEGDYCRYEFITLEYADYALKRANGFRNEALKGKVVKAFFEAHKRILSKDSNSCFCGLILRSLIGYRDAFAKYEKEIVQDNLDWLDRVEAKALTDGNKTDSYAHTMEQQVEILCDYYHLIGEHSKIGELIDRLVIVMKCAIQARGGMWGQIMLGRMQEMYRKYGFDRKANHLYVDIVKLGKQTLNELSPVEIPLTIPNDKIQKLFDTSLKGSLEEVLVRYILNFIPIKEIEIKRQNEASKESAFFDAITTLNIDASGIAVNRIGCGNNSDEQKLHHRMYQGITISAIYMRMVMQEIIDKKHLTIDSLMDMFKGCPLVIDDTKPLLERGLEAYLAGDDIACCHILVPQFESMFRLLIRLTGGEILRQSRDPEEGNDYYSLETLLGSPTAKMVLPDDIIEYFKVLFVSHAGWNIRGLLSHGLFRASSINHAMSDRVVHAILILSQIRVKDDV